ncbi:bacillithiol biosynthesis deacetylase BshB1 [Brumimicrobium aurantiacum]|uniref:Bacillithiol biosynthesis deacetylase BshB1 n=1 Tax=Brumimicrobium aurantiacum TaxID=1737063 RepID=A0A3E1EYP1_9FLAO|nr:bacillithiol biosynthesis deacetylase BshB1 [Brumimicrobium aurantiacum]RFC54681.1 bacillithiol biosynthesis deacetylase BshB1 [Brumimicrobium aurantiacum]
MSKYKVDILAIGAHPDDVELAAGGTIIKSVQQGKKVAIVDLTQGELGSRGTIDTRYAEADKAAKIMGVAYRENLKLADGFFEINESSLLKLVAAIRKYQPEIVLANAPTDRHPDHGRGSDFISRACFLAGLLKIETTSEGEGQQHWRPKKVYHYIQDRYLKPDFIVDVSAYKTEKFDAILAYETQFFQENMKGPKTPISGQDFLDALEARLVQFGRDIGVKYGEGFIVERPVGISDISSLL